MSHRRFRPEFRWDSVDVLRYKESGSHFRGVTRQVLFDAPHDLPAQLRYFEVGPGGHTTLERHEHAHAVVIVRGRGDVLVGRAIFDVAPFDLIEVPPKTWHQLRAGTHEPLGFLCLVSSERDRPERPSDRDLAELRADADVAAFIRL